MMRQYVDPIQRKYAKLCEHFDKVQDFFMAISTSVETKNKKERYAVYNKTN